MKLKQRLAIFFITLFAFTGVGAVGSVATAAPADAYMVTNQYKSGGGYLQTVYKCYRDHNWYEAVVEGKRDDWYLCTQYERWIYFGRYGW